LVTLDKLFQQGKEQLKTQGLLNDRSELNKLFEKYSFIWYKRSTLDKLKEQLKVEL
jgi:hypothetical protein